eukprot:31417-Pelagococcus_subviridis.AAC.2
MTWTFHWTRESDGEGAGGRTRSRVDRRKHDRTHLSIDTTPSRTGRYRSRLTERRMAARPGSSSTRATSARAFDTMS